MVWRVISKRIVEIVCRSLLKTCGLLTTCAIWEKVRRKELKLFYFNFFLFYYHQHHDCHGTVVPMKPLIITLIVWNAIIAYFQQEAHPLLPPQRGGSHPGGLAICPTHHVQPIPHELVESGCYSLVYRDMKNPAVSE